MSKTLAQEAVDYEAAKVGLDRRLANATKTIGETQVAMQVDAGSVVVQLAIQGRYLSWSAADFQRIIGWFSKHYGPFDPAVGPGEEA